jgi:hypothetical protein
MLASGRTARFLKVVAVCGVGLAAGGCDEDAFGVLGVLEPTHELLAGNWSGFARISNSTDPISMLGEGRGVSYSFPVALSLSYGGTFVLRTVGLPSSNGGGSPDHQPCVGLFAVRGRYIEFFANQSCSALPLNSFTVGRALDRTLVLEAEAGPARLGPGHTSPAFVRVVLRLERI